MEMTAFQRRVAAAVVSVAAVTAMSAAVAPAPASAAGDYYGAIAASHHLDSEGYPQLGGRVNLPTKAAADSAAMSDCGLSDCEVFIDFQDCAVVGWDAPNKDLIGGHGPTLKAAIQAAAEHLESGAKASIVMQGCNKGFG